jgi:hypothetical protein
MATPKFPPSRQSLLRVQRRSAKLRRSTVSDAEDGRVIRRMPLRRLKSSRMRMAKVERVERTGLQ